MLAITYVIPYLSLWSLTRRVVIAERIRAENAEALGARRVLASLFASQGRLAEARTLIAEVRAINPELTAGHAAVRMPGGREETIENPRRAGLP